MDTHDTRLLPIFGFTDPLDEDEEPLLTLRFGELRTRGDHWRVR